MVRENRLFRTLMKHACAHRVPLNARRVAGSSSGGADARGGGRRGEAAVSWVRVQRLFTSPSKTLFFFARRHASGDLPSSGMIHREIAFGCTTLSAA